MRRLLLAISTVVVLLLAACECLDEEGNTYSCSCSKRCNGATSTYSTSFGCQTGDPSGSAQSQCIRSCSPEASCSGCTCSRGASCTIEKICR